MLTGDPSASFTVSTVLSLAVRATDANNGQTITDAVEVSLIGDPHSPLAHPSDYSLFTDRGSGEVTVVIDGGARYHDRTVTVNLDRIEPTNPTVEVELTPSD